VTTAHATKPKATLVPNSNCTVMAPPAFCSPKFIGGGKGSGRRIDERQPVADV
jgi:hypothetical protein